MAPEQLAGREVDARTDIFGLGVVLYCVLTSTAPFEGAERSAPPPPPPTVVNWIPQPADEVVMKVVPRQRSNSLT